jgi:rhodanese-related sulfurtransferase
MIKKFLMILLMVNMSLLADFKSIDYKEVKELQESQGAVLIDIRTPQEWEETGVVPGSQKIMFFDEKGNYDVNAWMAEFGQYVPTQDKPFVLICRTASRTGLVGQFLDKQGYKHVYHLKGGITFGYKDMGYKTVK